MENTSDITKFILVGLTDAPKLQIPLFIIFTLIYLIILFGNLGMIMMILLDSQLHTPMYFLLCNLSLVDSVYASAITPKVLERFLTINKIISYNGCAAQIFFLAFGAIGSLILASMVYDCHAAMCKPLHYTTIMTSTSCFLIVTCCYICGIVQSSIHDALAFRLSFCHSNVINHFFCDIPPLLDISCFDTHTNEITILILSTLDAIFTLLVILNTYLLIIENLRMSSAETQRKAFSICAFHLITVSIFFGSTMFMYLQPSSNHSIDTDKIASVLYTMAIPMLNPVVYSLRNKEVKNAFKKVVGKLMSSLQLFN